MRYFIGFIALCLLPRFAEAGTVNVGALSFDTFIPAGNGVPGVDAFNLANLTGAFGLPPDFPVADSLTFGAATLTLTLSDLSQDVIALGDIGPGFLLDMSGNPVVQVPDNDVFDSAEFTATLSPLTFTLADASQFTAGSASIDVLLLPSSGTALTADVDQTTISVAAAGQTATPEPATGFLMTFALLWLLWAVQPRRPLRTKAQEQRV